MKNNEDLDSSQVVFDFLMEAENNIKINWEESYRNLSNLCGEYSKKIAVLDLKIQHRIKEHTMKGKKITPDELRKKIDDDLDTLRSEMEADKNADIFYFPGTRDGYFTDHDALIWLHKMVDFDNYFEVPFMDIGVMRNCILALKSAFYSLLRGAGGQVNITIRLQEIMHDLIKYTDTLELDFFANENKRNLGREDAITTEAKYRELEGNAEVCRKIKKILIKRKLKNDQGEIREVNKLNKQIDNLIGKELKTDDTKTKKIYRDKFIEDFSLKNQEDS